MRSGKQVVTVRVKTKVQYGRTLGELCLPDGRHLNREILEGCHVEGRFAGRGLLTSVGFILYHALFKELASDFQMASPRIRLTFPKKIMGVVGQKIEAFLQGTYKIDTFPTLPVMEMLHAPLPSLLDGDEANKAIRSFGKVQLSFHKANLISGQLRFCFQKILLHAPDFLP